MTVDRWVPLRRLRWHGYRRWHNFAVGPLCVGFYVYPPGQRFGRRVAGIRTRVFVTHSWRYVHADGEGRHLSSLRRWRRARRDYRAVGS